jgi:hypothetical protein
MYLVKGGRADTGEVLHVFVEARPGGNVPAGCQVVEGVTLNAHPLCDDPDAPTLRLLLYRDREKPTVYHYRLPQALAGHLKRVGGSPFVYPTWEEFVQNHPAVVAEMAR